MTRIRHLFLLLLCIGAKAFSADGCTVTILESTNRHILVDVTFDSIRFVQRQQDGRWFTDIVVPKAGSTADPGLPQLPLSTVRLGIPESARPRLIILSEHIDTKNIGAVKMIDPVDGQAPNTTSSFYPQATAEVALDAFIRDQRVLHIRVFPVRYQTTTHMAQILKNIQFKIDFAVQAQPSLGTPNSSPDSIFVDVLDNYESSIKWRRSSSPALAKGNSTTVPMAKLFIKKDGVYKVTGHELAKNGVDIHSIDPRQLALSNKGRPVPIVVEGKNDGQLDYEDRIVFLGQHNTGENTHLSLFSDTNVYQLTWNNQGLAFAELPASPDGTEIDTLDMAPHIIHFEQDMRYERLVGHDNGDDDHWFWEKLMNDERINFPVSLPGLMENSAIKLTAKFHGLSESHDVEMNHHVVAYIDDQKVGEANGSQKKPFTLYSSPFSLNGRNSNRTVYFDLPLENAAVFADFVFLNWFEIEYDRRLSASTGELEFSVEPRQNRLWRLRGFSSDQVYLLTDTGYRLAQSKIQSRADGFELLTTFPSGQPAKLYAVEERALLSVIKIEMDEPSALSGNDSGADYVIITHDKFRSPADRLANYRSGHGLETMVVDIQDVYDEFSHSVYDPRAIKKFIAHTFFNWRKRPLYFLLFGDTTYLMNKDVAADATLESYIPSYMVNTKSFGMTSSDNYFACVSGDDALPDVYLGRLPANTLDDAETMVEKIISYETQGRAEEWRRHITLASGNGEFFDVSAQNLVDNYLPKWLVTSRLSTEYTSPYFNTTEDFINWMNSGQNIINFLVHGSGEQIADAKLFEKDDILRLSNEDRYAFAVTMSCYIGHFDHPEKNSLGEVLFTTPRKGIMGMFGSAGKSYLYSDYYFNAAVFDGILNKGWSSLGEITTNAKYELIAQTKGFWEPVHNFLLIGDPATRLHLPDKNLNMALQKKVLAEGDVLRVTGSTPSANGSLFIEALGPMDSVLVKTEQHVQNSTFDIELMRLDSRMRNKWGDFGGPGKVRAFFSDGAVSSIGLADFSVIQPLVSHFGIEPEHPTGFEPVSFRCEIADDVAIQVGGLKSIAVLWTKDQSTWNAIELVKKENIWVSAQTLAHAEGTAIFYKLKIETHSGTITESETRDYTVLYKPDVYVDFNLSYLENSLAVVVKNRGEASANNVVLRLTDKSTNQVLADDFYISRIAGRSDTTVTVPVHALSAGRHDVELNIDPENSIAEEEEENNQLLAPIYIATPEHGSAGEFSFQDMGCRITLSPNSISKSSSLKIVSVNETKLEKTASAASLVFLKSMASDITMLQVQTADSSVILSNLQLQLQADTADSTTAYFTSSGHARIYAWMEQKSAWRGLETTLDGQSAKATLPVGSTIFALLGSTDVDAPHVTISAQGQHFVDGDVVPQNPTFTVSIEDESGVDVSITGLQLWLDGNLLNESDYILSTTPDNPALAHISYTPELLRDEHLLKIQVRDVNANIQTKETTFRIAEKFGLDFIANHPNPFVDETTFAFNLTDVASTVDLDIYTVSGRLIRSFEFTDITGYNEIDSDGADSDGNEIANGVYYLKFSARHGDEKIERIERLAKLK
jgi:hypothetical protein